MVSALSSSLSGMNAAQMGLDASAQNIANMDTPNYRRRQVEQTATPDGVTASISQSSATGQDLVFDVVGHLQAKNSFLANLAVFRTSDRMMGSLLDLSS